MTGGMLTSGFPVRGHSTPKALCRHTVHWASLQEPGSGHPARPSSQKQPLPNPSIPGSGHTCSSSAVFTVSPVMCCIRRFTRATTGSSSSSSHELSQKGGRERKVGKAAYRRSHALPRVRATTNRQYRVSVLSREGAGRKDKPRQAPWSIN